MLSCIEKHVVSRIWNTGVFLNKETINKMHVLAFEFASEKWLNPGKSDATWEPKGQILKESNILPFLDITRIEWIGMPVKTVRRSNSRRGRNQPLHKIHLPFMI